MLIQPLRDCPPASLPGWPCYYAEACAELDRRVIEAGTPGFELMQRAARAAWAWIERAAPSGERLGVLCGGGNNGGDGLLVAVYAAQAGWQVRLWLACDPAQYRGEAAEAWQALQSLSDIQISCDLPALEALQTQDVLVDALLGIGLQGPVRGALVEWIERLNQTSRPVFCLDVPSGLSVDSGQPLGVSVQATQTLTFIALKPGLFTGQGRQLAGQVSWAPLGIDLEAWPVKPCAYLMAANTGQAWLPPRRQDAHKGSHGRVLILGGGIGMSGAVILAAQAALRSGAGLVRVLTDHQTVTPLLTAQPEVMVQSVAATDDLSEVKAALAWADVLLIGPGLGQQAWGQRLWRAVQGFKGPWVVDADALNLWAAGEAPALVAPRVITPHPAEAARLLDQSVESLQADRLQATRALVAKTGASVLLKGAGSCVMSPGDALPWICPFGNPGMAVAGMGDLLSGCIAALLAQGLSPAEALVLGVRLHAQAGDAAAADQPRGLLPSDLLGPLRAGVNARP